MPATNSGSNYISTLESLPLSFARLGRFYGGGLGDTDHGLYWSGTAPGWSSSYAYGLDYHTGRTYPQREDYKIDGYLVRCVAL